LHKFSIKRRRGRKISEAAMHGKHTEQGLDEKGKEIIKRK
jgi:hypothetical protein